MGNHQRQVNVPTYTAPTYIMTEVPLQHNRISYVTQQPQHQQQHHQIQQQIQLQQQVQHQVQQQQQQQPTEHENPHSFVQSQSQLQPQQQPPPPPPETKEKLERPYKCDQCPASFIYSGELSEHKKMHSGDGPFTCEDCHFTFMYQSHFRSHKTRCSKKTTTKVTKTKRAPRAPKQVAYASEDEEFNEMYVPGPPKPKASPKKAAAERKPSVSNQSFKRTKKVYSKVDRPFECNECDASFLSLQELQNHKTKHTGETYKCEECQFIFLYRKLYEDHRRQCEKKKKGSNPQPPRQAATSSHVVSHHSVEQHIQQQQPQPQIQQQQVHQQVLQVAHQQPQRTHREIIHSVEQHNPQQEHVVQVQRIAHHHPQHTQRGVPTTISSVAQDLIPQHQPAAIDMRAVQ